MPLLAPCSHIRPRFSKVALDVCGEKGGKDYWMTKVNSAVEVLNAAHQVLENFFDRHKDLKAKLKQSSSSVLQMDVGGGVAPETTGGISTPATGTMDPSGTVGASTDAKAPQHPGTAVLQDTATSKLAKDLTSWVAKTVCWGGQQPKAKASSVLQLQRSGQLQRAATLGALPSAEPPKLQDATATQPQVYCKDQVMRLAKWSRKTFLCASD